MKLMGMGLEIDQEDYLTSLIETSFSETLEAVDIGQQLRESFSFILNNLEETMNKHDYLLDAFVMSQTCKEQVEEDDIDDGIELF